MEQVIEEVIEAPKVDFFIRLNSENDLPQVFSDFYKQDYITVVDEETGESTQVADGEKYLVTHTHDYAIDVVGVIHEPTGNTLTDAEGNEYPETAPVDGWHVNVRLVGDAMRETVEALDALYGVVPNSPSRVFL
jgi:hypothetical protein